MKRVGGWGLERAQQRFRLADAASQRQGLGAECVGALPVVEVHDAREPGPQLDRQWVIVLAEHRERLLEKYHRLLVQSTAAGVGVWKAERGLREARVVFGAPGKLGRVSVGRPRLGLTRCALDGRER